MIHLYEVPRGFRLIEMDNVMMSARGWGRGIVNSCSMTTEFHFFQNEKSSEDGWWGWLPNTVKLLNATEVRVLVAQLCLTIWGSQGLQPSRLLLSMGFSRQKYWSGLPFPSPEDLPDPGIKPALQGSMCIAGRFLTSEPPGKPLMPVSCALKNG